MKPSTSLTPLAALVVATAAAAALVPIPSCGALVIPDGAPPGPRPPLSSSLPPSFSSPSDATGAFVTRRSAAIAAFGCLFSIPTAALASSPSGDDNNTDEPFELDDAQKAAAAAAAEAAAAKERMRQRIAASKTSYRKSSDLVMQRRDATDYSCVAETGSPCPEGLVPRAVQREIVGALDRLKGDE